VELPGIRASTGHVRLGLASSAAEFPDHATSTASPAAAPGTVRAVFHGIPPGRYAVSAFLDPDDLNRLSTGLFGIPSEPYGFSNDARGTFGPPSWERASVSVPSQGATITIHLR